MLIVLIKSRDFSLIYLNRGLIVCKLKIVSMNKIKLFSYSPRSFQQRPPSSSRPSSGDQRRHRSDHLLPIASSRNRSKHRSNSNDSRRSGSGTRARSSSATKRSPSPAG